ncbi:MAG: radical SAM protein [Planctomycetota bacterium]|nr:radical SAM protein [Planctomycetota bacterium]
MPRRRSFIRDEETDAGPLRGPQLAVWRLRLPAASTPLILRRDRPFDTEQPTVSTADVLRYVAVARQTLSGPLVLEIEGPGDPLASPDTVLRALALIHEHHPDVLTGLVVDGPLLAEYVDELEDFGLNYLALRLDAVSETAARKLVSGAVYRAEVLEREDAATLYLEESMRALYVARRRGLPVAVRTTVIPTLNLFEIGAIAEMAATAGAQRMDLFPHVPVPDGPLARAGVPTKGEMEEARADVARVFRDTPRPQDLAGAPALTWLAPERFNEVDVDQLDAVDVMRILPDPFEPPEEGKVLPPRRAQIIAVATRDGTLVDQRLSAAEFLRIYIVTPNHLKCLGVRRLSDDPRRRQDGVGDARVFLEALVGCRALVATHFTKRAVTLLQAVGVLPVAVGGPVEETLDRVARGTMRHA